MFSKEHTGGWWRQGSQRADAEDATSPRAQAGEHHPVVFPLAFPKRGLPKPNPSSLWKSA